MQYELVIKGGKIATQSDIFTADIGISAGKIVAIGANLSSAKQEINAHGKWVLPGGVDSHCHIEQLSGAGIMNADSFETATRSAAYGGTTSVISFAAQHVGMRLNKVVADYAKLAQQGAIIDYAIHIIVADISDKNLSEDLPKLISQGHRSIKIFTTYDKVRLQDEQILDTLLCARENGALVCFHAENDGLLRWMSKKLLQKGYSTPNFHVQSHPRIAEIEAINRMIQFSKFIDQPIVIFHVSTIEGIELIRAAQTEGIKVFAETCPHYLFMDADELASPKIETAKKLCSPPQRRKADQHALWDALERGDLQIISSDHAPYRFDETGKLSNGANAPFNAIANGMPGLELRLPLMFDAMVSRGKLGIKKFVELTATAPAQIYNLAGKGSICIGADADIAIWDGEKQVTLGENDLHDNTGYNPFVGRTIKGWPETVLLGGNIIIHNGELKAKPGSGKFINRAVGESMRPTGNLVSEMNPELNFGAEIY